MRDEQKWEIRYMGTHVPIFLFLQPADIFPISFETGQCIPHLLRITIDQTFGAYPAGIFWQQVLKLAWNFFLGGFGLCVRLGYSSCDSFLLTEWI